MRGSVAALGIAGLLVGTVVGAAVAFVAIDRDEPSDDVALPVSEDEADVAVFLERDVTDEQRESLGSTLEEDDRIESVDYVDLAESEAEFRRIFEDNPEMLERVGDDPDLLPTSYRIKLTEAGWDELGELVDELHEEAGVMRIHVIPECDDVDNTSTTWNQARCRLPS